MAFLSFGSNGLVNHSSSTKKTKHHLLKPSSPGLTLPCFTLNPPHSPASLLALVRLPVSPIHRCAISGPDFPASEHHCSPSLPIYPALLPSDSPDREFHS